MIKTVKLLLLLFTPSTPSLVWTLEFDTFLATKTFQRTLDIFIEHFYGNCPLPSLHGTAPDPSHLLLETLQIHHLPPEAPDRPSCPSLPCPCPCPCQSWCFKSKSEENKFHKGYNTHWLGNLGYYM